MLSFYKPKNSLLAKYIEGYYFLKSDDINFSISYYTFPNNFQIVTCALGSEVQIEKDHLVSSYKNDAEFISTIICNYSKPIMIEYHGKVNEVTVYFKPLGLNYFIKDIDRFYKKKNFSAFIPENDFQKQMEIVLAKNSLEESIECLEMYWLSQFRRINIEKVELILTLLDEMNVQEVSEKIGISRQYLHKIFKLYLGKTPSEYKRIQRFRNTVDFPQSDLTQLELQNMYYDQSHFIKDVLHFTNTLPKIFFKKIEFKTTNPWLII